MDGGFAVLTREMEMDATDELIARLTAERDAAVVEIAKLRARVADLEWHNARLIAASPELLEACKSLVTACDSAPPVDLLKHIVAAADKARAAIAKARGEK